MATPLYKVEGVVLRKWRMGERDQVIALLTPTRGRLDLAVRGGTRAGSPAVRLEPFMRVRVLAARGRTLDSLAQAEVLDARRSLSEDLYRLACGTYVLELFYRTVEPGPCPTSNLLFGALVRSLDEVDVASGIDGEVACRRAELRLVTVLGCPPCLDACVGCQERVVPTHFSPRLGGVLCSSCRVGAEGARSLSPVAWDLLRRLPSPDVRSLAHVREEIEPWAFREVELHLCAWLDWHCSVPVRSRKFLAQVGKPSSRVS